MVDSSDCGTLFDKFIGVRQYSAMRLPSYLFDIVMISARMTCGLPPYTNAYIDRLSHLYNVEQVDTAKSLQQSSAQLIRFYLGVNSTCTASHALLCNPCSSTEEAILF